MSSAFTAANRDGTSSGRSGHHRIRLVLGWVGVVLHSTYVALHYFLSPLVMPTWAAYILWGVWALFLVLAIHLLRRRSAWAIAVPFAAYGLWVVVGMLGDALLGWTA